MPPLLVVCGLSGEEAVAVFLFDLDAGLEGALQLLLVLADFRVFLNFNVRNDIFGVHSWDSDQFCR